MNYKTRRTISLIVLIVLIVGVVFIIKTVKNKYDEEYKTYPLTKEQVGQVFDDPNFLTPKNILKYKLKRNKKNVSPDSQMISLETDFGEGFNILIYAFEDSGKPVGIMFSRKAIDNELLTVSPSNKDNFKDFIENNFKEGY